MFVSINWIREFCPFETGDAESPDGTAQKGGGQNWSRALGARFSLHGAEVEHVEERCSHLGDFVTARVLEVRPHPNAERLTLVKIDAGERGGTLDVVCGAPNVRAGIVVPYVAPGKVVNGREIEEVAIRGVLSRGMLCSEKEIGVSEEASGLWEFPEETSPGLSLLELYPELRDVVLEIDNKSITHRPDLWGHYGLAREFSAIYRAPLRKLGVDERLARARGSSAIRVRLVGEGIGGRGGLCPRYCGLQIDGVRVGPSPRWLQHRLLAVGSRPISNIVDVTNYILYEIGQPLHAFDVSRVGGGEIQVRRARAGERLRLLDGSEVGLETEDCVIADATEPVALAGIMGGASSEISEATTSVFLESANFAPARIRTTAAFIAGRLGTGLSPTEVRATLRSLGFEVQGKSAGEWTVRVPSWRATKDVSIREDLVEEVGRIHGYDRIAPSSPLWEVEPAPVNQHRRLERTVKTYLALHGGLTEVFTYSMVGKDHCASFGLDPAVHIRLQNPISEDMDRLRREVIPIHLEKAKENQRYLKSFGFFEVGRVYRKPPDRLSSPELPDERSHVAGVVSFQEKRPENFYAVRDIVLGLLEHVLARDPAVVPPGEGEAIEPWAHPSVYGRVLVGGEPCGSVYRAHPATEARLELEGDTIAFDLDLETIFSSAKREIEYRPPLRYPTVPFDVAVVAREKVPVGDILDIIRRSAGAFLLSAEVFDVFVGGQCGAGKKSVAFHLIFGSPERTLAGEEVTALQDSVIAALDGAGYPLRR